MAGAIAQIVELVLFIYKIKLIAVWEKIIALEDKKVLSYTRVDISGYTILFEVYAYTTTGTNFTHFYHTCNETGDCNNMIEVYFKTILNFINWYNTIEFETNFKTPKLSAIDKTLLKIYDKLPNAIKKLGDSI